jgi:hypothetical protein
MRLTRAGIALIIVLLVICPVLAGISYAALSGQPVGPIAFGSKATATPTQPGVVVATHTPRPAARPALALPRLQRPV